MDEVNFEFTVDQEERIQEQIRRTIDSFNAFYDALVEIVNELIEAVRKVAEILARFFLKKQLLEWRIPEGIADFISEKMYWRWAFRLGFNWFERKLATIE